MSLSKTVEGTRCASPQSSETPQQQQTLRSSSATTSRIEPAAPTVKRPASSEGISRGAVSLWREAQTVQAYTGSSVTRLPSPGSWATRTAASYALASGPSRITTEQQSGGYEEVMELKRQLANTRQDLHLTKISRSLSTGNGSAVVNMLSPTEPGTPGSPYRTTSGNSMNGSAKPSLSKELMQKLRSMTETIKMLSDENALLRDSNEGMKQEIDLEKAYKEKAANGDYDDLEKPQLIDLVVSYDAKLKSLSMEVTDLQKRLRAADAAQREVEAATQTTKSAAEKDKYKQLARRLKDERNQYRDTCEEKQQEQASLKVEMEKMSELISELRINCQTLQTELLECRQVKDRSDVGVQAVLIGETTSRPSTRKTSTSSITAESIRKARSVYGVKQPKPRYKEQLNNNSSSSSVGSSAAKEDHHKRSDRGTSMSPKKPLSNSVSPMKNNNNNGGGPKFAKPVSRNNANVKKTNKIPVSTMTSPGKLPSSMSTPASSISSVASPGRTLMSSRIPQPGSSATNSPIKTRIPSAPRYHTPQRRSPSVKSASPVSYKENSPPPPPPPTQLHDTSTTTNTSVQATPSPDVRKEDSSSHDDISALPTPPGSPPPPPPVSRVSQPKSNQEDLLIDSEEEEEEDILCVTSDGHVEMTSSRSNTSHSKAMEMESPIVPSVQEKMSPYSNNNNNNNNNDTKEDNSQHSGSGADTEPSADDERSRDGEQQEVVKQQSPPQPLSVSCTPRTKKRVDNFRQGLAARRIQRTWKHFYEELEERRESNQEIPTPLLSVKEEVKAESPVPDSDEKEASPEPSKTTSEEEEAEDAAVRLIQAALSGHEVRSKALTGLRARIHTARPWQKKKMANNANNEESSEEETDRACRSIQNVLRAHDARTKALERLEADKDLFTCGKVSEIRAKFNERRAKQAAMNERSDGITDDDDDVVVLNILIRNLCVSVFYIFVCTTASKPSSYFNV